jgi:hypothetical protein
MWDFAATSGNVGFSKNGLRPTLGPARLTSVDRLDQLPDGRPLGNYRGLQASPGLRWPSCRLTGNCPTPQPALSSGERVAGNTVKFGAGWKLTLPEHATLAVRGMA